MTNCKHIQRKLSAFQDGELPPENLESIRLHLKECPACSAQWTNLQNLWETLNSLPESRPRHYAASRIKAELTSINHRSPSLWPARIGLAASVAAALLLGFFAGGVWHPATASVEKTADQWARELCIDSMAEMPENSLSAFYFASQNQNDGQNDE